MKISNNMKHNKKRVRRKFWPSKCLNSLHNLWFLLHSNVSKCPLHLLIIHPSSKFLLITYLIFQGLFIFILHVLRNADVRAAYLRKKTNWKAARSIGRSHTANHDSIALGWSNMRSDKDKDKIREANPTVHRKDQSDQLLVMKNHLLLTTTDVWPL